MTDADLEESMKEDAIRSEIQHMMREIGFDDYHPPDMRAVTNLTSGKAPGRPDIFCLNPAGPTVVIEVKRISPLVREEPWFDPEKISNNQRDWLDWWTYGRLGKGYIGIGTTFGKPRRLWIIPWDNWNLLEHKISSRQAENMSPPMALPAARITITDLELMKAFECEWKGSGIWQLPEFHPIYLVPTMIHNKNQFVVQSFRYTEKEI